MSNIHSASDPLTSRLKHFIVDTFRLRDVAADQITDDEPLIGGGLGLDSLDALELALGLEEKFGITVHSQDESQVALASIASLAGFIRAQAPGASFVPLDGVMDRPAVSVDCPPAGNTPWFPAVDPAILVA